MNIDSKVRKSLLAYYLALFGLGLTTITVGPALPWLAEQTGVDISDISILFTFKEIGHLIGALVLVRLLDRMNGHKALGIFILIVSVLLVFFPLVPQLLALAVLILVLGVFASGIDSGTNTLLLWLFKEKSASYLNGLHLMFGLGGLAAPLIFAQVLNITGDIDWVFWLVALFLAPGGLIALTLPAPDKPSEEETAANGSGTKILIFLVAGFFFAYVAAEVAFSGWIYTYSLEKSLASEVNSAYLNSIFWATLTFGRLISIPLAARWKTNKIMRINFFGALLSMTLLIIGQNSFVLVLIGGAGLGLSTASMFPTMMAIANQKMVITAKVGGLILSGAALGAMSIPWLIGQFFETAGPSMLFYIVGLLFLLSFIFYQFVNNSETKR